jgi:hypothetical protein
MFGIDADDELSGKGRGATCGIPSSITTPIRIAKRMNATNPMISGSHNARHRSVQPTAEAANPARRDVVTQEP